MTTTLTGSGLRSGLRLATRFAWFFGAIAFVQGPALAQQPTGTLPPDTVGDVGPKHYIQMVNTAFAIYDKNGNLLVGPTPINALWSGFGGACETQNNGDPIVRYD